MKILFCHTGLNSAEAFKGGAEIQAILLKEEYKKLGHSVEFTNAITDFRPFDIVHITGDGDIAIAACDACVRQRRQYFLKPLFHPKRPWNLKKLVQCMRAASAVLVESPKELEAIYSFYATYSNDVLNCNFYVVPPGVNPIFTNHHFDRSLVVMAARYVDLKNQKDVILACKNLGLPLIITGTVQDQKYFNECCQIQWGVLLKLIPQSQLAMLLGAAKVCVCASIYEVCSASICEAINCGCLVVTSSTHQGISNFTKPGCFVYEQGNFEDLQEKINLAYNANTKQANHCWSVRELCEFQLRLFRDRRVLL